MSITGGVVSFEDGIKSDVEYTPPRKVRVELRFDIDPTLNEDGVSATINAVGEQAKAKVYELLGSPAPAAKGRKTGGAKPGPGAPSPQDESRVLNDKEKLAAAQGLTAAPKAEAKQPDPAAMDEFTVGAEELTQVAAEPVTDAELNSAVHKKNGEIKNPAAIRAVISGFNPDPSKQFTLAQIPQDQRRTFLEKLKELKA